MIAAEDNSTDNIAEPHRQPILSVVVATLETWPRIQKFIEPLMIQAESPDIELIIADGGGNALPGNLSGGVVRLQEPGSSVYRLRALGAQKARGRIIAFTEDHCKVCADWCDRIMFAHRQHPNIGVISGIVENGSTDSMLDRIHFLMTKGPFMAPITSRETNLISGEPNISFKKDILPVNATEINEAFYRNIHARGIKTRFHDDIIVWHTQSLGFKRTCGINYHNGRTIAGNRLPLLSVQRRLLRLASCFILPGFLTARTLAVVFRKRRGRTTAIGGLPMLALLAACHSAGEFIGYLAGAGDSPQKIS